MMQELRANMESNIPLLEMKIDLIIESKEISPKKIEGLLDILLDYMYAGVGEDQFKKLNSYYSSFNPEYSAEYDKFYHELLSE